MTCNFADKVSRLIDGALSARESADMRVHLEACTECRTSMEEFLRLREALKTYPSPSDDFTQRRALNTILSSGSSAIWTRTISVPVPAMALLLVTLVVLAAWSLAINLSRPTGPATSSQPANAVDVADRASTKTGAELSRLDHGGRAVIIKVRKGGGLDASQTGRTNQ